MIDQYRARQDSRTTRDSVKSGPFFRVHCALILVRQAPWKMRTTRMRNLGARCRPLAPHCPLRAQTGFCLETAIFFRYASHLRISASMLPGIDRSFPRLPPEFCPPTGCRGAGEITTSVRAWRRLPILPVIQRPASIEGASDLIDNQIRGWLQKSPRQRQSLFSPPESRPRVALMALPALR